MKKQIYNNCKSLINETANTEHKHNPKDKPRVREVLNNLLDDLIRQIDFHAMKDTISKGKAEQFKKWLTSYTCKRHIK